MLYKNVKFEPLTTLPVDSYDELEGQFEFILKFNSEFEIVFYGIFKDDKLKKLKIDGVYRDNDYYKLNSAELKIVERLVKSAGVNELFKL